MGIHINGGTVIATGSMLDRIENGGQNYAVFNFAGKQSGKEAISFKDKDNKTVFEFAPENAYTILVYSSPELKEGEYTLYSGEKQLASSGGFGGGGMRPDAMTRPERPEGEENNFERPNGNKRPEDMPEFEDREPPEFQGQPQGGERPQTPDFNNASNTEKTEIFKIQKGANIFSGISYLN